MTQSAFMRVLEESLPEAAPALVDLRKTEPDGSTRPQPRLDEGHPHPGAHRIALVPDTTRDQTADLHRTREQARNWSGEVATAAQHKRGKLTVWERIEVLLDEGSFVELEGFRLHRAAGFGLESKKTPGDGLVAGWGLIDGRRVFVYGSDFRVLGGSLGEAHADKVHRVQELAEATGAPLIALNDGAGARIQEGVSALAGYGGIFRRAVRASGVIPQISVILGPCAGGAAYSPALSDFVFMVRGVGQMYLTGPDVVATVTGEQVTHEQLGGADMHGSESGSATFVHTDELECLADVRYLISLLPANNVDEPGRVVCDDPADRYCERLLDLVPAEPQRPYDMREVIAEIVDDAEYLELHEQWAPNILCMLARLDGRVVGIVANQPQHLAGVIDISASEKAARFVQTCDAFSIPLVTLVDVPGFMPGTDQERRGAIRHGAKLLHAYCAATVPRVQVIVRKAYGGAFIVMDSRSIGADLSFAWPINEIAVMGADAAVEIIHRRELSQAANPEHTRRQRVSQYKEQLAHPYYAAQRGLVDDVIDPGDTRRVLAAALDAVAAKRVQPVPRRHANPPT